MKDANYFIEKLDMIAHPEGGYYKESFISAENITDSDSTTFEDKRILWTSIYFY